MLKSVLFGRVALVLGAVLAAAGCQSANSSHAMSGDVHCSHCKVTDVHAPYTVPSYEGPREVGYLTHADLECPTCRHAAEVHSTTGNLEPVCPTCGGHRSIAMAK